MTDQQLLDNLTAGKESAFREVYDRYYLPLTVFANKFLNDLDLARETVQDLFVRLYEKRSALEIHTSLKSHLYQSVRNACLNVIKKNKMQAQHHDSIRYLSSESDIESSDQVMQTELEHQLYKAIDQLPDQCKRIFKMNRFDGFKNQEIADELNISKRTVETQISKALKTLRVQLEGYLKVAILFMMHFFQSFF